jgi:hypothetical protein
MSWYIAIGGIFADHRRACIHLFKMSAVARALLITLSAVTRARSVFVYVVNYCACPVSIATTYILLFLKENCCKNSWLLRNFTYVLILISSFYYSFACYMGTWPG